MPRPAVQIERKKKAMMRMRLDEFVGEAPEEEQEHHAGGPSWGREPAWSRPQVTEGVKTSVQIEPSKAGDS